MAHVVRFLDSDDKQFWISQIFPSANNDSLAERCGALNTPTFGFPRSRRGLHFSATLNLQVQNCHVAKQPLEFVHLHVWIDGNASPNCCLPLGRVKWSQVYSIILNHRIKALHADISMNLDEIGCAPTLALCPEGLFFILCQDNSFIPLLYFWIKWKKALWGRF